MLQDRYGLEVSTSSVEACDAYIDAVDRMFVADGQVEVAVEAALAADPNFALAHVTLARHHHVNGRADQAREAADTAVELAASTTPRERRHVEILHHVINGKVQRSLELTREHLRDHPRDAFVLAPACGVFGTIGFSGRRDREVELLAFLEPLTTHYGDDWWFQTVYAFALLETGQWARGRELAERSLEQRPDNPHGAHTLAHALYEAGADDEALAFMSDWIPGSDPGSLLHCHNWWHYTLLLLHAGRHDDAVQAFADNCMPRTTASPSINVFTDSASFLWRAELAGLRRDHEKWEAVRAYYEEQFRRPIVFVDAHAALPYAALGESERLQACIAELDELGEAGKLPAQTTAAALAHAHAAFAVEDWDQAIERFEPLIDEVVRIGGSRAQRDLQTNTLLAAYANAGRRADAEAFLAAVHDRRPTRPIASLEVAR